MDSAHKQKVTIITTYRLGEDEISRITQHIPNLSEYEVEQIIDKNIIAGIIIKTRSTMIDLSLKSELQKLQLMMYETN
ncbi:F0F1 ATP synthase subunit delta [Candidatus Woesebacteria bacterium]|nr:F0F1 ATP synthase subunit delta [Candidatus Woesebacteria bacterium]